MEDERKISPKDIYESLWKCRDFELSHLWQRSIFLTAFLTMSYVGYGTVILKICENICSSNPPFFILNILALFIALIGYVLSILWIMMAKGSKAWYEKYEHAIYKIERDPKYSSTIVCENMDRDQVMHGSLPTPKLDKHKLFNTRAGRYSVSKINIGIGQLSAIVWFLLFFANSIWFFCSPQMHKAIGCCLPVLFLIGLFCAFAFIFICNLSKLKNMFRSSGI